jgi:hypothetical protein
MLVTQASVIIGKYQAAAGPAGAGVDFDAASLADLLPLGTGYGATPPWISMQ